MNLDEQLTELLHDDAASATPAPDSLDAKATVRRTRRHRAMSLASTAIVSAAVIAVFVVSFRTLMPTGTQGNGLPAGPSAPRDLSNEQVRDPGPALTNVILPFLEMDYPSTWIGLASDSGPDPRVVDGAADTLQITNFDPGFDANLCLGGGSEIPPAGIVMHVSATDPMYSLHAPDSIDDMSSMGSSVPQTCEAAGTGTVYAGSADRVPSSEYTWVVIVAGPEADPAAVKTLLELFDNGSTSGSDAPSAVHSMGSDGATLILGAGSTPVLLDSKATSWALTIRPGESRAAGEAIVRVLNYAQSPGPNGQPFDGTDLRTVDAPAGSGDVIFFSSKDRDGWLVTMTGVVDGGIDSVTYEPRSGPSVPATMMDVPDSVFGQPTNAFILTFQTSDGGQLSGLLVDRFQTGTASDSFDLASFPWDVDGLRGAMEGSSSAQAQAGADELAKAASAASAWYTAHGSYDGFAAEDALASNPDLHICGPTDCNWNLGDTKIVIREPFGDHVVLQVEDTKSAVDGTGPPQTPCLAMNGDQPGSIQQGSVWDVSAKECYPPGVQVPEDPARVILQRAYDAIHIANPAAVDYAGLNPDSAHGRDPADTFCTPEGFRSCTPTVNQNTYDLWPPVVEVTYHSPQGFVLTTYGHAGTFCISSGSGGGDEILPISASTPAGCSRTWMPDLEAE